MKDGDKNFNGFGKYSKEILYEVIEIQRKGRHANNRITRVWTTIGKANAIDGLFLCLFNTKYA